MLLSSRIRSVVFALESGIFGLQMKVLVSNGNHQIWFRQP
uniref:Uncharacterized protein n=1 Tax=Anguilla anguilla TaxID=7936 RepID=A0A0E9SQS0_ANGAN